jgi:DNA-directed RNA polymerase specialized sigma24 family protein
LGVLSYRVQKKMASAVNRSPLKRTEAMDNDELIAAVAGGDDVALCELFARHAPWLAVRLRAMMPAADVEDVAALTGVPAGTVKSRAYQVRRLMHEARPRWSAR